jgi:ribosomal protein S18 acetylase RimI-like enzyme
MLRRGVQVQRVDDRTVEKLAGLFGEELLLQDRLRRQQDKQGVLLAAQVRGEVVGMIYVWLEQAEEDAIREQLPNVPLLMQLEVHRDHRGRGIGRQLVRKAEKTLRRRGHKQAALAVRTDNERAIRLYDHIGYTQWGHEVVCHAFETHEAEHCYVMVKDLTNRALRIPRHMPLPSQTLVRRNKEPQLAGAVAAGGPETREQEIVA